MAYLSTIIIVIIFLLLPIVYFIWSAFQFKKDIPKIKIVWKAIGKFNQYLLKMGFVFLIPIPVLKGLPEKDLYPVAFLIELLPAIATGFFVTGLIAFAKKMHEYNENNT